MVEGIQLVEQPGTREAQRRTRLACGPDVDEPV